MHLIDSRFKQNKWAYIWQPVAAAVYILVVLMGFETIGKIDVLGAIGLSALASSAFICFTQQERAGLTLRHLLGGYCIAMLAGSLFKAVTAIASYTENPLTYGHTLIICAILAAGVAMLFMVILNMEHPPAAGLAIGLVLEAWSLRTLAAIIVAILLLFALRLLLKPYMRNLL